MEKEYKKTFKSNPELLPEIEEFILDIVDKINIDESVRNNIELAVAEAAANSILHGNKSDQNKNVHIRFKISKSEMCISFTDEGNGFKIEDVPDPIIPENILKGSGRGIHIMKNLVDKIDYIFSDNGTEVILKFKI